MPPHVPLILLAFLVDERWNQNLRRKTKLAPYVLVLASSAAACKIFRKQDSSFVISPRSTRLVVGLPI
jgi:hypothetical protein